MALLSPPTLSTAGMSYNRDTHTISCEISDLGPNFRMGQVYDDACDEGVTLVSHRTHNRVVYAVNEYRRDNDNDMVCWVLVPVKPSGRRDPVYPELVIWND